MKTIGEMLLHVLNIFHAALVFIVVFGWAFSSIFYVYGLFLFGTALSWLFFWRCILLDLEKFIVRKFRLPVKKIKASFIATSLSNMFGREIISDRLITIAGAIFLPVSIYFWVFGFIDKSSLI